MRPALVLLLSIFVAPAWAQAGVCSSGTVFADSNANGQRDRGERGLQGIKVSDGVRIVATAHDGSYTLPAVDGRTVFAIKPAGYRFPSAVDGMPDFWRHLRMQAGPSLKYGGIPVQPAGCRDFALVPQKQRKGGILDVLIFSDPQTKSLTDVGYYERDVIDSVLGNQARASADVGISLGDITHDDLSLYPALNRATAKLGVPWLHVAGNHDLDFDAPRDEDSLLTFRNTYGPDTFAWEEPQAVFIGLDDVVYRPKPDGSYIGGLREDQFAFLSGYLPTVPRDRLVVVGVHIPFFDAAPGKETFRHADRERLFALLKDFPHVLLLSGHSHVQQHYWHAARDGWQGAAPLHEYNIGAACGAFWSGAPDAQGIPDATMADGTPNGYAVLTVGGDGGYSLAYHPARAPVDQPAFTQAIALHAPRSLRRGAYPAWGVFANVFMGDADTRVEYRVDGGPWKPMRRVERTDPRLLVENVADDLATTLRGFDRSPEAVPSTHLWRGALPTDLSAGEHRVEVRALDRWEGETTASTTYSLQDAAP